MFTRSLNTGDVVQPSDLSYQPVQAHLASANVSPQDIIGKSARYPLAGIIVILVVALLLAGQKHVPRMVIIVVPL